MNYSVVYFNDNINLHSEIIHTHRKHNRNLSSNMKFNFISKSQTIVVELFFHFGRLQQVRDIQAGNTVQQFESWTMLNGEI